MLQEQREQVKNILIALDNETYSEEHLKKMISEENSNDGCEYRKIALKILLDELNFITEAKNSHNKKKVAHKKDLIDNLKIRAKNMKNNGSCSKKRWCQDDGVIKLTPYRRIELELESLAA